MGQIIKSRPLKNKKNKFINEVYDKVDVLRTVAYTEGSVNWFHRMNELCIWLGEQLEYLVVYGEVDEEELSEAVITM